MNYVLGFMFSESLHEVCLIKKNRPVWQAGRINGIGGKVEQDECNLAAMVREFYEETGTATSPKDWVEVAELKFTDTKISTTNVSVFASRNQEAFDTAMTKTDEAVLKIPIGMIPTYEAVNNVAQLVTLCIHALRLHRTTCS